MLNRVTLVGHLGRDPEVRRLENGTSVGKFSMNGMTLSFGGYRLNKLKRP
jgi:single-stranded DNA-binding protein